MRRLAALLSLLAAPLLFAAGNIVGTWELVDATPVPFNTSDPHGIVNHKLYFTADGRMYIIAPDEKLQPDDMSVSYTFENDVRTLTLPGGEVHRSSVVIDGDTMRIKTEDGVTFRYKRLNGTHAFDKELEPHSVEVLDVPGESPAPAPRYDTRDYSKQPLGQRIRGVWEVMRYSGVKFQPPQEGFPNDKYIITATEVAMIPPTSTRIEGESHGKYQLNGSTMVVDDGSMWTISFNRWNRLVLKRDDAELTMRLVSKDTSTIPALPVRIVLFDPNE